jgi:hypothetical protein
MIDLLTQVRDHLTPTYPHVGAGVRPDPVPDGMAWVRLTTADARPDDPANDIVLHDEVLTSRVQVSVFGWSPEQVAAVSNVIDTTIRDGLTIPGRSVQLVERERAQGPQRDTTTFPDDQHHQYLSWYRIDHAPNLETS